jgi:hypothetical protein
MANKFFNKRSAVVIDGLPKLPTPDSIEYGEIAINYADGVETISIKNSANEIVEFKSKEYFERIIENNEEIIAASLVHIDERIDEIEDNMAENEAFILLDEKVTNVQEQVTDVLEEIEENEKVTAMSISHLNDEINGLKTEQERLSADAEENKRSIKKLLALKPDMLLFGHGNPIVGQASTQLTAFAQRLGISDSLTPAYQ